MWLEGLVIITFLQVVSGVDVADVDKLYKNLTKSYNMEVRPNHDDNSPTIVHVAFHLVAIKEFEEKNSKLAIVGLFDIIWSDFRMRWNPLDFGGATDILMSQNKVWAPHLFLVNPYNELKEMGMDMLKIRYLYNGTAYWSPGDVLEATCSANVVYYPFDLQKCQLMFIPWHYLPTEVFFELVDDSADVQLFQENPTWEVETIEFSSDILTITTTQQLIVLDITFRRRSRFFIVNIIVPIWIVELMNILVFLLPASSGERVSFSVTVLLAISVFLTIVSDKLPSSSEPDIAYLSYFIMMDLSASAMMTILTILVLKIYSLEKDSPVPKCFQKLLNCCSRKRKLKKGNKAVMHDFTEDNVNRRNEAKHDRKNRSSSRTTYRNQIDNFSTVGDDRRHELPHYLYNHEIPRNKLCTSPSSKYDQDFANFHTRGESKRKVTWHHVGLFLDKVCFCCFMLLVLIKNALFLVMFNAAQ